MKWALDLIDMYDLRLGQLDEPHELVYSARHTQALTTARNMVAVLAGGGGTDHARDLRALLSDIERAPAVGRVSISSDDQALFVDIHDGPAATVAALHPEGVDLIARPTTPRDLMAETISGVQELIRQSKQTDAEIDEILSDVHAREGAKEESEKRGRHSNHPCEKCGALEVYVKTNGDDDDKCITCYACKHSYMVDGADS